MGDVGCMHGASLLRSAYPALLHAWCGWACFCICMTGCACAVLGHQLLVGVPALCLQPLPTVIEPCFQLLPLPAPSS